MYRSQPQNPLRLFISFTTKPCQMAERTAKKCSLSQQCCNFFRSFPSALRNGYSWWHIGENRVLYTPCLDAKKPFSFLGCLRNTKEGKSRDFFRKQQNGFPYVAALCRKPRRYLGKYSLSLRGTTAKKYPVTSPLVFIKGESL